MNNIGERIYILRKNNEMSQEQFAELLNVSRQSVSKWERGETLPDIYNLEAISKLFKVSIDSMVTDIYGTEDRAQRIISKSDALYSEKLNSRGTLYSAIAIGLFLLSGLLFAAFEHLSEAAAIAFFGAAFAAATALFIYGNSQKNRAMEIIGVIRKRKSTSSSENQNENVLKEKDCET